MLLRSRLCWLFSSLFTHFSALSLSIFAFFSPFASVNKRNDISVISIHSFISFFHWISMIFYICVLFILIAHARLDSSQFRYNSFLQDFSSFFSQRQWLHHHSGSNNNTFFLRLTRVTSGAAVREREKKSEIMGSCFSNLYKSFAIATRNSKKKNIQNENSNERNIYIFDL